MRSGYIKINLTKVAILLFSLKVLLDCQNSNLLVVPAAFDNFCIVFAVGVFLIKMVSYRFTLKEFLIFAGSAIWILFTCYQIQRYDLLISFISIYLLKDENLDEYISMIFKFQIGAMIVIFCALSIYHMGYADYIYWYRLGGRIRFTGCMQHPNILSGYVMVLIMMYSWLNFDDMTQKKYILLTIITVVCFLLTDTRTTFILSVLFLVLLYFAKNPRLQAWYKKYLKYMFPVLGMIIYLMMTRYTQGYAWVTKADELISGRIKLGAYAYNQSGLTIFPRFLEYVERGVVDWTQQWGLNEFAFDNIYSNIWVEFGVIWLIFITVLLWKFIRKTDYKCHLFILMWIIYGLTEVQGLNCYRCFPTLLLVKVFDTKQKKEIRR